MVKGHKNSPRKLNNPLKWPVATFCHLPLVPRPALMKVTVLLINPSISVSGTKISVPNAPVGPKDEIALEKIKAGGTNVLFIPSSIWLQLAHPIRIGGEEKKNNSFFLCLDV